MGASGIVSSVLLSPIKTMKDPSQHWKLVFLASFLSTAAFIFGPKYDLLQPNANSRSLSTAAYALAGLFVGFGTKLSNGCTSGHGICGLARFSKRSLAAVATFMTTGMLTAVLTASDSILSPYLSLLWTGDASAERFPGHGIYLSLASLAAAAMAPYFHRGCESKDDRAKLMPSALAGSLFAAGLYVSTMVVQSKVFGFLQINHLSRGTWDPTLAAVMGGGLVMSMLGYQFVEGYGLPSSTKLKKPVCMSDDCRFGIPTNTVIDWQLLLGAACFGIGWGIAGACPGPAVSLAGFGVKPILMSWWPAYFVGARLAADIKK